ncbi:g8755 [Coccomyxa viridis]|uniref:G8755 protein n=1 Tax=Coccomyxa viridis TaxID=1274662 RepID=A0ABP1G3I9_9CHLO
MQNGSRETNADLNADKHAGEDMCKFASFKDADVIDLRSWAPGAILDIGDFEDDAIEPYSGPWPDDIGDS